jgi:hypothetical protein
MAFDLLRNLVAYAGDSWKEPGNPPSLTVGISRRGESISLIHSYRITRIEGNEARKENLPFSGFLYYLPLCPHQGIIDRSR